LTLKQRCIATKSRPMTSTLIDQLLDHAAPERILQQVRTALKEEAAERAAFREWLKPDVKAEFINGAIIMHSPAKRRHNQAVKFISSLLDMHAERHNAGEVAIEKALAALERNDVEPDICFWKTATAATFTDEMDVYPAPDLVVEVLSNSTKGRDRGIKKDAYLLDGVTEYWIVDAKMHTVEQFVLKEKHHDAPIYELKGKFSGDDTITSVVLSDFTIPTQACFERAARGKLLQAWAGGE
ncbi:MAG: Uma2 family endonuclease, partial [Bacteroidota bacterium]